MARGPEAVAQEGGPAAALGPAVAAALVAVAPAAGAARGLVGPAVAAGVEAVAGAVRELVGVAEEARSSRLHVTPRPLTSTSVGRCPTPALVALLRRWAVTPLLLADPLPARPHLVDQVPGGGRWHYETSGSPDKAAAQTLLATRRGQRASGAPVQPRLDGVTYAAADAALRTHYEVTGSRDLAGAALRLAHLDGLFSGCRLVAITTAACETYAGKRQGEEAANGTINRELAVLGRMLRLAHEHDRLARAAVALLNGDKDGDNRPVRLETRRASG